jgi:hypothetical protein
MFDFKPQDNKDIVVPFFDDVSSRDGWEGHTTTRSIEKLKQEIAENLTLIGCVLTGFQQGKYGDRHGYQIHFAMKAAGGKLMPSRLDIACLPLNPKKRVRNSRSKRGVDWRIEGTQKMALYMTAKAIKGMYFLTMLSPAYIPFLSLMLDSSNQTLGQIWVQHGNLVPLLPSPSDEFDIVEGQVK